MAVHLLATGGDRRTAETLAYEAAMAVGESLSANRGLVSLTVGRAKASSHLPRSGTILRAGASAS